MNGFALTLIAVCVLALAECVYGLIKRSKALAVVGLVIAVMCALALIPAIRYADAVYISAWGYSA